MSAPVTFSTFTTASGHSFGHAVLNNPAALNALTLPMIDLLDPQLKSWAEDDSIAGVVLSAAGDKAFCAGGDVVSLHHASKRVETGVVPPEAEAFSSANTGWTTAYTLTPNPFCVGHTAL